MPAEISTESTGPTWRDEILGPRGLSRWDQLALSGPESLHRRRPPTAAALVYLSSGSTGHPKAVAYTERDWRNGVSHRAECLSAVGVRPADTAAVVLPFGPWFSGDQVCDALVSLGVRVLPVGHYGPHLPAAACLMATLGTTVMVTTSSLAYLMPPETPRMRLVVLLGERCPAPLRRALQDRFGAEVRSIYAASEAIIGPDLDEGVEAYAWNRDRLHLEILDAEGRVHDQGQGELLVTRRMGEATPLIRYRLGDWVELGSGRLRLLGRIGHAFTLASGVKVTRRRLEEILDGLGHPIAEARFRIEHRPAGDLLQVHLQSPVRGLRPEAVEAALLDGDLDLADAVASGHVRLQVRCDHGTARAKRRLVVEEYPWSL